MVSLASRRRYVGMTKLSSGALVGEVARCQAGILIVARLDVKWS
jgi:hypothetical protein